MRPEQVGCRDEARRGRGAGAAARLHIAAHAFGQVGSRKRGSRFFIGDALSALDIYWATFAAMNNPLPDELCPMAPGFRSVYTNNDPTIKGATTPILLEHRDFIYHNFLELPLDC